MPATEIANGLFLIKSMLSNWRGVNGGLGTGGTLTHLCRLKQFYWQRYKMPSPPLITVMPSPPLITVPGVQAMALRAA